MITDNRFPYWVYGGQQESGSAGVASRSDYGEITFREWHPVGVEEYGYVAPDPLDPNIIYGGQRDALQPDHRRSAASGPATVLRGEKYRFVRTMPLIFSPVDPHVLYLGSQCSFQDHQRRPQLGDHQSGFDAREVRYSAERRRLHRAKLAKKPRAAA